MWNGGPIAGSMRAMAEYTVDLRTRVTPEQRDAFDVIARRKGLQPGTYLRLLVIEAIEREAIQEKRERRD